MQHHPKYYFRVPFTSSMIGICDKVRTLKNFNDCITGDSWYIRILWIFFTFDYSYKSVPTIVISCWWLLKFEPVLNFLFRCSGKRENRYKMVTSYSNECKSQKLRDILWLFSPLATSHAPSHLWVETIDLHLRNRLWIISQQRLNLSRSTSWEVHNIFSSV
jgi:hypothetical protein